VIQYNNRDEPMGQVWLTVAEFNELILLIDDEEGDPDEDLLRGVRQKLASKRGRLQRELVDLEASRG
jgi:hypothetical protein